MSPVRPWNQRYQRDLKVLLMCVHLESAYLLMFVCTCIYRLISTDMNRDARIYGLAEIHLFPRC